MATGTIDPATGQFINPTTGLPVGTNALTPQVSPPLTLEPTDTSTFFELLQQFRQQALEAQQTDLRNLGPQIQQALSAFAPEIATAQDTLLRQARDPLAGGFGEDIRDRVRVAQSQSGLFAGSQAARQEAALLARSAAQRRLQAGEQLQGLGDLQARFFGLDSPLVTDLMGLGQQFLAAQTLEATRRAGEIQSQIQNELLQRFGPGLTQGGSFSGRTSSRRSVSATVGGGGGGQAPVSSGGFSLLFNPGLLTGSAFPGVSGGGVDLSIEPGSQGEAVQGGGTTGAFAPAAPGPIESGRGISDQPAAFQSSSFFALNAPSTRRSRFQA